MTRSYKIFRTLFLFSILFIAAAIVSLILFKIIGFTGNIAASIVGLTAILGGGLSIISNIGRFFAAPHKEASTADRFILLLEWIFCGAVISFAGFIILYGGFLK